MTENTKLIPFQFEGDTIDVMREGEDVFVSVKRVCEALGVALQSQLEKLKSKPWARVTLSVTTGADGKSYEMAMLHLDSLPMWLATINEARVSPAVRPKLVRYQLECARVLRDHFLRPKQQQQQPLFPAGVVIGDLHRLERTLASAMRNGAITRGEYRVATRATLFAAGLVLDVEPAEELDVWSEHLREALKDAEWVTVGDVLELMRAKRNRTNEMRAAQALQHLGFTRRRQQRFDGLRVWGYVRDEEVQ